MGHASAMQVGLAVIGQFLQGCIGLRYLLTLTLFTGFDWVYSRGQFQGKSTGCPCCVESYCCYSSFLDPNKTTASSLLLILRTYNRLPVPIGTRQQFFTLWTWNTFLDLYLNCKGKQIGIVCDGLNCHVTNVGLDLYICCIP